EIFGNRPSSGRKLAQKVASMIASTVLLSGGDASSVSPANRAFVMWRAKCASTVGATVAAAWEVGIIVIYETYSVGFRFLVFERQSLKAKDQSLFSGKQGLLIDEANWISPRIKRIERTFTPWSLRNVTRAIAMYVFSGQAVQRFRTSVYSLEI